MPSRSSRSRPASRTSVSEPTGSASLAIAIFNEPPNRALVEPTVTATVGPMTVPTLLVTGPVGVGKSTVAAAVSDLLTMRGVAHAFADMDCFSHFHPRPADDRFGSRLTLEAP